MTMAGDHRLTANAPHAMTLAQKVAGVVGALFLAVGVLGFIPGITTHVGDMTFASHDSPSELLGVFQVSVLHNIVHLLFGLAGLAAMAAGFRASRSFLIGGGVIYLVLWLYGLFIDKTSDANFVPLNTADDWLHFGLGIVMVALGLLVGRELMTANQAARRR